MPPSADPSRRYSLGLKWKMFTCLAILGLCSQGFDLWHSARLINQATTNTEGGVKALLFHFLAFQRAISQGHAAAVDAWANSVRLQQALSTGHETDRRSILLSLHESLQQTLQPDLIVLSDKSGLSIFGHQSPISPDEAQQMKVFSDLRIGQVIRNQYVEHRGVTYVVNGSPVERNGQQVGLLLLGVRLERLMRDFKTQNEEAGQRRLELALVHNAHVTGSTLEGEALRAVPDATRQERRETITEGERKVSIIRLPDGPYEFQMEALNGYDQALSAYIGGLYLCRSRSDKEQHIRALVQDSYQVMLVALFVALLAAALVTWLVMRPIRAFITATQAIARGRGDLTQRLPVGSADELGQLAQNLNELFDHLYRLAQDVHGAGKQVGRSSAEISGMGRQMLQGAKDQSIKIESSGAAITELSASIQQVADNAMQATRVARESGDKVQVAIDGMNRIRQTVEQASERIHELGESGKRIGNIVEVIRQISEQTSLLALNASIEAAHAGEQGRGFAVVADEVSSLARRVGQSAKDIEDLIATIKDQTDEAVRSMQNGTREVEGGTLVVNQTLGSLREIVHVVQDTANAVQEQAVVSDEIARNMDAVRTITHGVLASLEEAVAQGEVLHSLALRLEESVRGFNVADRERA